MPRLEIQIDMASTSEKIDIERTTKTAEHVFDVLGGSGTAMGKRADRAWPWAAHRRGESEISGNNRDSTRKGSRPSSNECGNAFQ
jgi:hypothetical protein